MYIQEVSRKYGSHLTLVMLPAHDTKQCAVLHEIAKELDIHVVDACELRKANPSWFLAGDGPFSAVGTKAMATIVADYVGR